MSLLSVRLLLPADEAEALSDALCAVGALAVTVSDAEAGQPDETPLFGEPGAATAMWSRCEVSALFAVDAPVSAHMAEAATLAGMQIPAYSIGQVEETDWVGASREQFQPTEVASDLWIVPSWHADRILPGGAISILLDPGAAFGTGSHPTTQLCLRWLKTALASQPGAKVLDYGTGSGILAIAAAKLGASSVLGVDIDPQALEVARYNAERNTVRVDFIHASRPLETLHAVVPSSGFDLVVANILANPLILLASLLASQTRAGGQLALAGVLADQADDVLAAYQPWYQLTLLARQDEWVCLAGSRK